MEQRQTGVEPIGWLETEVASNAISAIDFEGGRFHDGLGEPSRSAGVQEDLDGGGRDVLSLFLRRRSGWVSQLCEMLPRIIHDPALGHIGGHWVDQVSDVLIGKTVSRFGELVRSTVASMSASSSQRASRKKGMSKVP